MRRLFIVLAKLFGLVQIYWTLTYFVQIGFLMGRIVRIPYPSLGQMVVEVIGVIVYTALSAGMAWLLITKTDWLADKLKIGSETVESEGIKEDILLRCGVKLIGLFVTVYAIPALIRALLQSGIFGTVDYGVTSQAFSRIAWSFLDSVLAPALQLALGLFLALKSAMVIKWITKQSKPIT